MVMKVSVIAVLSEFALVKTDQTLYNTYLVLQGPALQVKYGIIWRSTDTYQSYAEWTDVYSWRFKTVEPQKLPMWLPTGSNAVCIPRQDDGMHSLALASMSGLLKKNPWVKKELTVFVSRGNGLQASLPSASSMLQEEVLYNSVQKEYIVYRLWCFQ